MSKLEVNAIEPQSGTTLTVGASGDTIVIPSGATISNQGTAAGFGPTGAVSWNTTKITANPNPAVTGVGYFCDTTSAAFTVTLPSSPSAGAVVGICDYANTFATNNLTVGRNGSNIGGVATNGILSTNGLSVTFVYVDATQGWIVTDSGNRSDIPTPQFVAATGGCITTCGNYKIHSFTGPGTFTVSNAGNATGSNSVDYLVVAGGGAGGGQHGAGGGAGGFRESKATGAPWTASPLASSTSLPVSIQGYPISVGGGGTAPAGGAGGTYGTPGTSSIFSTITSAGGGKGASEAIFQTQSFIEGGSGGGGMYQPNPGNGPGTGNTPPVSPSQGNPGGAGSPYPPSAASGGGGGAGGAGTQSGGPAGAGAGGPGVTTSISGSSTAYAGGGGAGATAYGGTPKGLGGPGGGGDGITSPASTPAIAGTTNRGGGGGGGYGGSPPGVGAAGGSGIVIVRYKYQ
jgi:hypothetical protein